MTRAHDPDPHHDPGPARRRRRRNLLRLAGVAVLGLAGTGAWLGAEVAADQVEARANAAVRAALAEAGQDWAGAEADGLRLTLTGTAPDEAARLRAIAAVSEVVAPLRIVDEIAVTLPEAPPPPPFGVEILANADGVSLVGLVPADTDRAAAIAALTGAGAPQVSDLLASADNPVAESWPASFAFGLEAVAIARQAKISVQPGAVSVSAIAADAREKARIEQALLAARPAEVALSMDIRAPLPVIAPFTLRYVLDGEGGRFETCAADSPEARDIIIAAAAALGAPPDDCALGIGAPNADWGHAAALAIAALGQLGAGSVTLSDRAVALEVPPTIAPEALDAAVARLRTALPQPYRLSAQRIEPVSTATSAIEFSATRSSLDGPARLRGRTSNDQMRAAVETVARARFGAIESALESDANAPGGWTVRVVAGIEALSMLATGSVVVTPDLVQIEGVSGDPEAAAAVTAKLASRLGAGARYAIRLAYDRRLDPDLGLPDGEACVARLNAVLDAAKLHFAPSSAEFEGDIAATLAELRRAMTDCGDYRIEIGGHTDSQGSDSFNAELSQKRADAVLAAMHEAGLAVANLTAHGYGESQPIAGNDTEAGREQNRRIEMRLVSAEPVTEAAPEPGELITGVTGEDPPETGAPTGPEKGAEVEAGSWIEPGTGRVATPAGTGEAADAPAPAEGDPKTEAPAAPEGETVPAQAADSAAAPDPAAPAEAEAAPESPPAEPATAAPAAAAGPRLPPAAGDSATGGDAEAASEVPPGAAPGYSAGETPADDPDRPPQRPALD